MKVTTADEFYSASASSPTLFRHDWRLVRHRDAVLRDLLGGDFPQRFHLSTGDKRGLPHGRSLRLSYADGAAVLRLDQGFGYWAPNAPLAFGFSAGVADQVSELRTTGFRVRAASPHATFIAVNDES